MLRSLASDVVWEQPVIKSDYPPVDPKQWDRAKKEMNEGDYHWFVQHVIHISGIWSVFDEKGIADVVDLYRAPVYGEIGIWGRVAKFTLGYRSEWCMIRKLFVVKKYAKLELARRGENLIKQLEQRYGCDVEVV